MNMPRVKLNNGLLVANFSSKHSFEFESGEHLPGCEESRAKALSLDSVEVESASPCGRFTDIELRFVMSQVVSDALNEAMAESVDVILVPLPVMQAAKEVSHPALPKMRTSRAANRVSKTVHSSRFCK
jgi:hypothetical protein